MDFSQPVIIIGAACLLASFAAYLRNTEKPVFPIVLALVGVSLCGVPYIKATLPGGGSIELSNVIETTKQASATVEAGTDALDKQGAVIDALGTRIDALQAQIKTLQADLNDRLAQTNTAPVPLPDPQKAQAADATVNAALAASRVAHQRLILQGNALRVAVKALPGGQ